LRSNLPTSTAVRRWRGVEIRDLLTVDEVAEFLRLTAKGIYSLVEQRRIPFIKVSNRLRFARADVLAWLEGNRVPASEE
jgi:excisionase family DNA binding protein